MHLSETKHLLFAFTNSSFLGNIWLRSSDTCVPYSGTRVPVCSGSHSASSDADPERQQVAAHPEAPCHSLARAELYSGSGFGPIQFQLLEVLAEWSSGWELCGPSLAFPFLPCHLCFWNNTFLKIFTLFEDFLWGMNWSRSENWYSGRNLRKTLL